MKKNVTAARLSAVIDSYFSSCDAENRDKKSIVKPYTVSGLVCHLGITREELEKLCESGKFAHILCRAKAKIEAFIEENALTGGLSANASANSLKYNFGWGEKTEKADEKEKLPIAVTLSDEARELSK